jgi:transcription initiation factor TFIIB
MKDESTPAGMEGALPESSSGGWNRSAPGALVRPDRCRLCGSTRWAKDGTTGEVVCDVCGLVLETNALVNERSPLSARDAASSEGQGYGPATSPLLPDKGLFSEIGPPSRDSHGHALSRDHSSHYYHLRKLNHRLRAPRTRQRNLGIALAEVQRLTSVLSLSREVRESAILIYRQALDQKATRGKKIVALVAASVYAACRQCHVPRTLREVIDHSRASKIEVGRAFTLISRELKLALRPLEPRDYLVRFTQDLNLSREVRARVQVLLDQVERSYPTSGVLANGILATIIYIACNLTGEPRSQDRVAAVAKVTPVTIRNHYKELLELLGLPVDLTNPLAHPAAAHPLDPRVAGPPKADNL